MWSAWLVITCINLGNLIFKPSNEFTITSKGLLTTVCYFERAPYLTYSDADWAAYSNTHGSTYGLCIFLASNLISWRAKKQTIVAHSSTEAEYRAVAHSVAELVWIQYLLRELGVPLSSTPIVFCDNVSTTYLALNPVFHARTKHIEFDVHSVRERVFTGSLQVQYVPSNDQHADIFTKCLLSSLHATLRSNLLVLTLTSD